MVTPIYQIQGTGHTSAYDGQTVSTTGVVTAVDSNGFYIQDATGDGNAATSDAVFVFTGSAPTVAVGQQVMVTGTVDEFTPNDAAPGFLSITQIVAQNSSVVTLGIGAALAPVEIGGAGNLAPPTEDMAAGAAFWEALEGMLVKINDAVAVGPTNSFGEIYTVVDNDNDPSNGLNATGLTPRGTLQFTPGTPEADDPATTGTDSLTTTNTTGGDFNPERIQIDDDSGVLPGFVSPSVGPGAVLSDVVGVVSYNFANYEIVPTQAYTVVQASTLVKETTALVGTRGSSDGRELQRREPRRQRSAGALHHDRQRDRRPAQAAGRHRAAGNPGQRRRRRRHRFSGHQRRPSPCRSWSMP